MAQLQGAQFFEVAIICWEEKRLRRAQGRRAQKGLHLYTSSIARYNDISFALWNHFDVDVVFCFYPTIYCYHDGGLAGIEAPMCTPCPTTTRPWAMSSWHCARSDLMLRPSGFLRCSGTRWGTAARCGGNGGGVGNSPLPHSSGG